MWVSFGFAKLDPKFFFWFAKPTPFLEKKRESEISRVSLVREKKSGIGLVENRVNSILLFNAKKEWPNHILNPKLGGPDSQSRCGLMMMLRNACTMQLQLPPHDDGDWMKPRLERHGILYQPRLGVGIKVGGPARLLPTMRNLKNDLRAQTPDRELDSNLGHSPWTLAARSRSVCVHACVRVRVCGGCVCACVWRGRITA